MNARRWVAGSAAAAAIISLPAGAQAAPVVPQQAVLAAHEFPGGSTGYKVERETLTAPDGLPEGSPTDSPCGTGLAALARAMEGTEIVEAEAVHGTTELEASVLSRPVTAARSAATEACRADVDAADRPTILAAPDDLARLKPFIMAVGRNTLQAWVDVRGVTVIVEAEGKKDGAADSDVFWQTLRSQVAKVERQP
ncbi:hypothetical protein [Tsukamurella paurometabola]|uniref:Uncharacterized protein n=1 Tax=Tsukamurella paurometabola TaxID=2061 RepID=A0ABS5NJB3_TSUPA|nr:hypothetical protein [Tsukamurella paurometabola]MBS4104095.1 hypothetical protein [Tsukamurella paurometabola]